MSGRIERQGIIAPQAVPGNPQTIGELCADYPELADEFTSYVSWRDGPYDRYNRDFYKQYPSLEPYPFTW